MLKQELRRHSLIFAKKRDLRIDESYSSAIIFSDIADNFHPDSYRNICNHADWKARTLKPHPNVPGVNEMQSSNSSDALLMNIFCHPSIGEWKGVKKVLGSELDTFAFGVPGEIQLYKDEQDTTEIDLRLADSLCEAKFTETNFTKKRSSIVENYAGLKEAFHIEALPRKGDDYDNYQIIRNLLASIQYDQKHILFCDERRPDLARRYMETVSCLQDVKRRLNCRVIFWQELVAACGATLRDWIKEKYGI